MAITIRNNSKSDVLFSVFNPGDSGVPYSYKWIKAGSSDTLESPSALCVGAQMQSGGVWIGSDPKFGPNGAAGQTFTFDVVRTFST